MAKAPVQKLVGQEFDITYKNADGRNSEFFIEVIDAWVKDGFAYIEATNLDTDYDLTFRLDRIQDGIPNLARYLPRSRFLVRKRVWVYILILALVAAYFIL